MTELTFGQKAVGLTINPDCDESMTKCKLTLAELIDQMNDLRAGTAMNQQARLATVAITELEGALMWIILALTWRD